MPDGGLQRAPVLLGGDVGGATVIAHMTVAGMNRSDLRPPRTLSRRCTSRLAPPLDESIHRSMIDDGVSRNG